jgi:2-furoyl-CoA dehydrogenase large subunit
LATPPLSTRVRDKLSRIAAARLNVWPEDLVFAGGKVVAKTNPDAAIAFSRLAAMSHWAPDCFPMR